MALVPVRLVLMVVQRHWRSRVSSLSQDCWAPTESFGNFYISSDGSIAAATPISVYHAAVGHRVGCAGLACVAGADWIEARTGDGEKQSSSRIEAVHEIKFD